MTSALARCVSVLVAACSGLLALAGCLSAGAAPDAQAEPGNLDAGRDASVSSMDAGKPDADGRPDGSRTLDARPRLDAEPSDARSSDADAPDGAECYLELLPPSACEAPAVACADPPPECPIGYYPARDGEGDCWTGWCAPCTAPPGCSPIPITCMEEGQPPCPDGSFRANPSLALFEPCKPPTECVSCTEFCPWDIDPIRACLCAAGPPFCPPWQRPGLSGTCYTFDCVDCGPPV